MSDCGSQEDMRIRRMRDGGYLVLSVPFGTEVFAASSIDEALSYIRGQIVPLRPEPPKRVQKSDSNKDWIW